MINKEKFLPRFERWLKSKHEFGRIVLTTRVGVNLVYKLGETIAQVSVAPEDRQTGWRRQTHKFSGAFQIVQMEFFARTAKEFCTEEDIAWNSGMAKEIMAYISADAPTWGKDTDYALGMTSLGLAYVVGEGVLQAEVSA